MPPHFGQTEPFVVQVVGPDDEMHRFKEFIAPFSTFHTSSKHRTNNSNNTISASSNVISIKRKMNKNKTVHEVRFLISSGNSPNNNINNANGLSSPLPAHHQHINNSNTLRPQAYIVLCDSMDDDSLNRAADASQTVAEPQYPLIICDVNTSSENVEDCEAARIDLSTQLFALPEYCCTIPLAAWMYPEETLKLHRHWSVNEHAVDSLCTSVVDAVCFPKHLLWDGASLTSQARRALRRSFWMLDRDCDGCLSDIELAGFVQATYERPCSQEDIVEVKYFIEQLIDRQVADGADPEEARSRLLAAPPLASNAKKTSSSDSQQQQLLSSQNVSTKNCFVPLLGFFAVCHCMVSEARHTFVWKLLKNHGIQPYNDCRPWNDEEIEAAIELPPDTTTTCSAADLAAAAVNNNTYSLHLSEVGASFFASLYSKSSSSNSSGTVGADNNNNIISSSSFDPTSLFLFTPDCPWKTIYDLPNAQETKISVTEFVNCWKFMTQIDPATVAMFAKYWDFDGLMSQSQQQAGASNNGEDSTSSSSSITTTTTVVLRDLSSLFVARKMRRFRKGPELTPDICTPPSASFLVLGSVGCGKTSLMQHISNPVKSQQFRQQQIAYTPGRSVVLLPVHLQQQQTNSNISSNNNKKIATSSSSLTSSLSSSLPPSSKSTKEVLISLRELEDIETEDVLADTPIMDTIDGVMLCYDGNDPYSFGYIATLLPKLAKRDNLPIMIVMCKSDLPIEEQLGLNHSPEETCALHGLPWPPTVVNVVGNNSHTKNINKTRNDIDMVKTLLSELVLYPSLASIQKKSSNPEVDARMKALLSTRRKQQRRSRTSADNNNNSSSSTLVTVIKRSLALTAAACVGAYVGYYLDHKYHWYDKFMPPAAKENVTAAKEALPPGFRRVFVNILTKTRDAVDSVVNELMLKKESGGNTSSGVNNSTASTSNSGSASTE